MKNIEDFVEELNVKWPQNTPYKDCFILTVAKKYYKVWRSRDGVKANSIYAFIDIETGDLYRPASLTQPAKHIRGNINDESGIDACEEYGVKYLR